MNFIQLTYLALWYFKIKIFKKRIPIQTVLFISNICDYECKHCCIDKSKPVSMSYDEVKEHLLYSYNNGARFVDFEGGEPALWKDKDKNINDLCSLAKSIGFFSTTVTTNGGKDFSCIKADHIFVSLDGIKYEDEIRGAGAFERLSTNISRFPEPNKISANMVINSINRSETGDVIEYVQNSPYINGISLNFYHPVNNDTALCIEDKKTVIEDILKYKRKGYKILNTVYGLKCMLRKHSDSVCWMTDFITCDGIRYSGCPDKTFCHICGLGMYGEMRALYNLNFETVYEGIKLRAAQKP